MTHRNGGYAARLLLRVLAILGVSLGLALAAYFCNPNAPRYGRGQILPGEIALSNVPAEVVWVDARAHEEYLENHVAGALNINEDGYYSQIGRFLDATGGGKPVVVYCSSEACDSADSVVRMLKRETGIREIFVLHGGWDTVRSSHLRLTSGEEERKEESR